MRVGVDFDSVIVDNSPVWRKIYEDSGHEHENPFLSDPPTWSYFPDSCKACFDKCVNQVPLETPLVDGARRALIELSTFVELWIISHRPPKLTGDCIKVLKKNGIYDLFTSVDWSMKSKKETCRRYKIDVLIDDGPHNIEALVPTPTTPIVFSYNYNSYLSPSVLRVHGWGETVNVIRRLNGFYQGKSGGLGNYESNPTRS